MQGKAPVIVDNGVAGIAAALKADDHIRLCGQHVRDLALALRRPQLAPTIAFTMRNLLHSLVMNRVAALPKATPNPLYKE